jgi:hypothetical protein
MIKDTVINLWKNIQCSYGNHDWEKYEVKLIPCDNCGLTHDMYVRECKRCMKVDYKH